MKPLVYITRDIERALDISLDISSDKSNINPYKIITNVTAYAEIIARKYPNFVHMVKSDKILDTYELLKHPEVEKILLDMDSDILVFKNTPRIQTYVMSKGWNLINPDADLADKVERKISQVEWLGPLTRYLPSHEIKIAKDIQEDSWRLPFVLQWDHGHTGNSTLLIETKEQLEDIKKQFPDRPARISQYIHGTVYTQNIVAGSFIVPGSVSEQLTGLKPLTDAPRATVGNDWQSPTLLPTSVHDAISEIGTAVADRLSSHGWKGLFGIDVIVDANQKVYLLEINARQPASASLESQLQRKLGADKTIFDCHIASLRGQECPTGAAIPVDRGGQIVQRVTGNIKSIPQECIDFLQNKGYKTIYYPMNTVLGYDLLRIQTTEPIKDMIAHYREVMARFA